MRVASLVGAPELAAALALLLALLALTAAEEAALDSLADAEEAAAEVEEATEDADDRASAKDLPLAELAGVKEGAQEWLSLSANISGPQNPAARCVNSRFT